MNKNKEDQTTFLQRMGKIEFILFIFSFSGLILNVLHIKGGKLVLGLGLNAFALFYIFISITYRNIKTRNLIDRYIHTFAYLFLSVLNIGILFHILQVQGINFLVHIGMLLVLSIILVIQFRRIKSGSMSHLMRSLLYRLMIFWAVGFIAIYVLPKAIY